MTSSRISGLYRLTVAERIRTLEKQGCISSSDAEQLASGRPVLSVPAADKMIENVVATFMMPLGIAPNFIVNGRECIVPLVVEEPSIVAALSSAAMLARATGGFRVTADESLLTGQIHITGLDDVSVAADKILAAKSQLLDAANGTQTRLLGRGGGVRDIEVRTVLLDDGQTILAVHIQVDTRDAMGANLVNSLCEYLAPLVCETCGGEAVLRILSNLADRSLFTAEASFRLQDLADDQVAARQIRDRIVLANEIAKADVYRAATHNKGILNGIDALALATGNDWRAIEAGAHAYAARDQHYSSLTDWGIAANGDLQGQLRLPLKPGVVGGTVASNPHAALGLKLTGVRSAGELGELMAAVGLAQNFAALRALAGRGIQAGHMRLHARSVAQAAGVPADRIDAVASELVASGQVKVWKARELLNHGEPAATGEAAAGKVILIGEHAVVYGRHALALPIPAAVRATALRDGARTISVPAWGLSQSLVESDADGLVAAVQLIATELSLPDPNFSIHLHTRLPRAMGLGSSAAFAVAIARALARAYDLQPGDDRINQIAFHCEKLAHGTPSGIDNTLACYSRPVLYRRDARTHIKELSLSAAPPLVVAYGEQAGRTRQQVAGVRARRERSPLAYERLFDEMDALCLAASDALQTSDYDGLGACMNMGQGLLNAIEVSTPELEYMVSVARRAGALGAKLTGAGGGGSIVALCPGTKDRVALALRDAGFRTLDL